MSSRGVVGDMVGADGPDQAGLRGAAHPGDLCSMALAICTANVPTPPGSAGDQHVLPMPETQAALAALDANLFVVVAYGRILPQPLLEPATKGPVQRPRLVAAKAARGGADSVGDHQR